LFFNVFYAFDFGCCVIIAVSHLGQLMSTPSCGLAGYLRLAFHGNAACIILDDDGWIMYIPLKVC
jgi:hypothetical protein